MIVDLIIFLKRYLLFRFLFFYGGAFLLGLIGAFAMPPTSVWPLIFISLSGFYALYSFQTAPGRSFWLGFFYGLGYFVTGLWWIGNALLVEGNEFAWVWPISVIGLPTLLSLFTATAIACACVLASPQSLRGFFAFVGCLALSEWVRGHIFTGFPWNLYGYSWAENISLIQTAGLFGSYGLTLLTILWASTIGFLAVSSLQLKNKILFALGIAATFSLCLIYGTNRLNSAPTIYRADTAIHIIQPNIPQAEKWKAENLIGNFEKHIELSRYNVKDVPAEVRTAENHIVIWPETAIAPVLAESQAAREQISNMLSTYPRNAKLLSGALLRQMQDQQQQYTNSLVALDTQGALDPIYHKSHLVPFGEFIPFQDYIPIKPVTQFQGFERGNGPESFFIENIPAFSPLICYEIIFPGQMTENKMRATWLVTITNDAWYGDSAGPRQHFVHSIFRAVEEGLPVVRSANTGISGLVDAYGRTLKKSTLNQNWTTQVLLPYPAEKQTVFSKMGNYLFFSLCALFISLSWITRAHKP